MAEKEKREHITLQELERKAEEQFQMFLFIIWEPNPKRGVVKVILDDGTIKLHMKYDKFISTIENVLTSQQSMNIDIWRNLQRIKASLSEYQGIYYYDRMNNIYKRLSSVEDAPHLRLKDIFENEKSKKSQDGSLWDATKDDSLINEVVTKNRRAFDRKNNSIINNSLYAHLRTFGGM